MPQIDGFLALVPQTVTLVPQIEDLFTLVSQIEGFLALVPQTVTSVPQIDGFLALVPRNRKQFEALRQENPQFEAPK